MAQELRSAFGSDVQVLAAEAPGTPAQLVLTVADELREKMVIGVNVSGQVREFQLRTARAFERAHGQGQGHHRGR